MGVFAVCQLLRVGWKVGEFNRVRIGDHLVGDEVKSALR